MIGDARALALISRQPARQRLRLGLEAGQRGAGSSQRGGGFAARSLGGGPGRFGIGDTGFAGSNIGLAIGDGGAEGLQIRRRGQPCQPFGQVLRFSLGPGSAGGGGGSSIGGGAGSGRRSRMGGHRIRQGGFGGQRGGLGQRLPLGQCRALCRQRRQPFGQRSVFASESLTGDGGIIGKGGFARRVAVDTGDAGGQRGIAAGQFLRFGVKQGAALAQGLRGSGGFGFGLTQCG